MRKGVFLPFLLLCGALVWCARDKSPLGPGEQVGGCRQHDIPWPSLANSPWPVPHGDVQCTGRGRYPGPREGRIEWAFQIEWGTPNGSPVIGEDGTIYVVTERRLYAVNPDGTLKWEFVYPFTRPPGVVSNSSVIVGAGDIVYVPTGSQYREPGIWGYLYALDNGGNVLWEYRASGMFNLFSPAIGLDGTIYVTDTEGYLHAVAPGGGARWKVRGEGGFACRRWSSIAISPDGSRLYLAGLDSTMCGVDAATGSVLWKMQVGDDVYWAPLVDNQGNVYFYGRERNRDYYILSVDQEGRTRWKCEIPEVKGLEYDTDMHMDREGNLYFYAGYLYSLDCEGKLRWGAALPWRDETAACTPILGDSGGKVYLFMLTDYFYGVSAQGELFFACQVGRAALMWGAISDNGRLYVAAGVRLLCVK